MRRTALVTGGTRGIGRAISIALKNAGYAVGANYCGNDSVAAQFTEETGIPAFKWSVADYDACAEGVRQVEQALGPVDVLVNNAGITGFAQAPGLHDPEHVSLEAWRTVHRVNTDGVMLGCQWAIRLMKARQGGSIINLSSRSGVVGIPAAAAYAASKAAVLNHTRTVALYCAQQGYAIRCNAILPAAVLTPMWEDMLGEGEARDRAVADVEAGIPMGRFGRPGEVAETALFLASEASSYMTGTDLHLDGGILAGAASSPRRAEE